MRFILMVLCLLSVNFPWATTPSAIGQETTPADQQKNDQQKNSEQKKWTPLLPKEGLEGWAITDFSGPGEVRREGELLVLEKGEPLTGVHYKLEFPTDNYEIEMSAQRIEGSDFLCGLTFPIADSYCSFIGGGWGGGLVGLSSVDGYDASENATSNYHSFENGKWYKFRLRVEPTMVTGWIDDKEVFQQERAGHKFSTRIEVYDSRPLGLCAFRSKVAIRDLRWRKLEEAKPAQP